MEEYRNPLTTAAAVFLIVAGLYLALHTAPDIAPQFAAAPVPTLMATPALMVPTTQPTPVVVFVERPNQVVINQDVDVNVCIGLCR